VKKDGVAMVTLVLALAPAKLFVNDPPPLPPHPKINPQINSIKQQRHPRTQRWKAG
jgi:hypothetical protein